jgi:drug/metabolite transporter (DMT)-like permease
MDVAAFSTRSLLAMAYLTVFGSLVAFTAYIWLLQRAPATKVATYTYVNPVIAVLLGWLLLDEAITGTTMVAVLIIVLAVVLITARGPNKVKLRQSIVGEASRPESQSRIGGDAATSDSVTA